MTTFLCIVIAVLLVIIICMESRRAWFYDERFNSLFARVQHIEWRVKNMQKDKDCEIEALSVQPAANNGVME